MILQRTEAAPETYGERKPSLVIAIGGNAIVKEHQKGTVREQLENIQESCVSIAELYRQGYPVMVTHGNGPQIGNLLLQVEAGRKAESGEVVGQPIDICGAMTQGQIGYMIQQSLDNRLRKCGIRGKVVTIATQMVVSKKDPAFANPTKPIGPFYSGERVAEIMAGHPEYVLKEDAGRGFRRVVPSPLPLKMIEKDSARCLFQDGFLVIAAGGGGIPVVQDENGLHGVEAVIDKDLASAMVAGEIGADCLIILTGVDRVCINFRKQDERQICTMTVEEAQRYYEEGQFPAGSMGPKIQSAIRYLKAGGKKVMITSIEKLNDTLNGRNGTVITR